MSDMEIELLFGIRVNGNSQCHHSRENSAI